jgi:hypothetical protein
LTLRGNPQRSHCLTFFEFFLHLTKSNLYNHERRSQCPAKAKRNVA